MLVESLPFLEGLAQAERRGTSARILAEQVGAERMIVFVPDAETGTLLPAPGFPQTLPKGRVWRDLVQGCTPGRTREGTVVWPDLEGERPALAVGGPDGAVAVFVGAQVRPAECLELAPLLWMLTAMFRAERRVIASEGRAAVAAASARQAEALAAALSHAQAELSSALRRLRDADRRKDEFIAMLAHELRNPLAATANAVLVLKSEAGDPAAGARALDIVDRQTRNLSRLVDDLLDVSRITLGRLELRRAPLDLVAIVGRAAEAARLSIESAGQDLTLRLPATELLLEGDAVRLEQVVANLLTNAARYAGPGAQVTVQAEVQDERASVTVSDTGAGIAPELLPHLFEPFTQGSQGLARAEGGLGIGLALVRSIVEMHGGTVTAHSEGPGRGSQFTVGLPMTLASHRSAARPAEIAPAGPPRAGKSHRVLVVDDNEDSADMLAVLLGQWGHEIAVAHDGEEALREAERFRPDVVLLDIGLPGLSGYGVAERLRHAAGERPFLVALTGYGQPQDIAKAHESGFDLHLLKPVDPKRLRDAMSAADGRDQTPSTRRV